MQNLKGVIRFFTITLVLACLFQLSFTFMARHAENKADNYANDQIKVAEPGGLSSVQQVIFRDSVDQLKKISRRNYLDSISGIPMVDVWALRDIYTYKFCRDHALTLGLDLKGGMSLIMEIAEDDVLRKLANNNQDPQFLKAIENTKRAQETNASDFLSTFKQEFEKLNPNGKLAVIFNSEAYQGKINPSTSTNDEVINVLRKDFDAAIHETFNVLKTRIDQFGVASPNISLQANTGRIILELPGVDDPARVRKLLQQTAQLEFWDTYETSEVIQYLGDANSALRDALAKDKLNKDTGSVATSVDTSHSAMDLLTGGAAVKDTGKAAVAAETVRL